MNFGIQLVVTAIIVYIVLGIGAGMSGLVLDFGIGFGFHTSNEAKRIFIDSAGLGLLLGFVPALLLTALFGLRELSPF